MCGRFVFRTVNNITASIPVCHGCRKKSGETSSAGQALFLEGIFDVKWSGRLHESPYPPFLNPPYQYSYLIRGEGDKQEGGRQAD